jgi:hypothetical protein
MSDRSMSDSPKAVRSAADQASLEECRAALSTIRAAVESVTRIDSHGGSLKDEARVIADAIIALKKEETETILPVG